MNIYEILKNLFCNPKSSWILELDDDMINVIVIQRFLSQNSLSQKVSRIMSKYTFSMPPKMYLSCAWSLLFFNGIKLNKSPYIQYIKKNETQDEFDFILTKIKSQFKMSDRDFECNKNFVKNAIKKDKKNWFAYYGIAKVHWNKYMVDYKYMKEYGNRETPVTKTKSLLDF